jgi:hypothetical protein
MMCGTRTKTRMSRARRARFFYAGGQTLNAAAAFLKLFLMDECKRTSTRQTLQVICAARPVALLVLFRTLMWMVASWAALGDAATARVARTLYRETVRTRGFPRPAARAMVARDPAALRTLTACRNATRWTNCVAPESLTLSPARRRAKARAALTGNWSKARRRRRQSAMPSMGAGGVLAPPNAAPKDFVARHSTMIAARL